MALEDVRRPSTIILDQEEINFKNLIRNPVWKDGEVHSIMK